MDRIHKKDSDDSPKSNFKDYLWIFAHSVSILILMLTYPLWYIWLNGFDMPLLCGTLIDLTFILLFVFKPALGIAFVIFIFLICIKWGRIGYKEMLEKEAEYEKSRRYSSYGYEKYIKHMTSNIFSGLSPEEARRKYRRLMKEMHPDNNGDPDKCRKINAEYDSYKKGVTGVIITSERK